MRNQLNWNIPAARRFYWLCVLMLTLTGFGQMPIFKRYYIADIPGLGWLAQFYVTHYLHYLFGALFLGLLTYLAVYYLLSGDKRPPMHPVDWIRAGSLAGLLITGILLVIRNLEGIYWPSGWITALDVTHLALVLVLLITGLVAIIKAKTRTAT